MECKVLDSQIKNTIPKSLEHIEKIVSQNEKKKRPRSTTNDILIKTQQSNRARLQSRPTDKPDGEDNGENDGVDDGINEEDNDAFENTNGNETQSDETQSDETQSDETYSSESDTDSESDETANQTPRKTTSSTNNQRKLIVLGTQKSAQSSIIRKKKNTTQMRLAKPKKNGQVSRIEDDNPSLDEINVTELLELAKNGDFPKKTFRFGSYYRSYTQRLHFFKSIREFESIPVDSVEFRCKLCPQILRATFPKFTNLSHHLKLHDEFKN